MRKLIAIGLLLTLTLGCAAGSGYPSNVVMVNPNTGASVYIQEPFYYGFGLAVAAANAGAGQEHRRNVEAAKMMGYTEMQVVK